MWPPLAACGQFVLGEREIHWLFKHFCEREKIENSPKCDHKSRHLLAKSWSAKIQFARLSCAQIDLFESQQMLARIGSTESQD